MAALRRFTPTGKRADIAKILHGVQRGNCPGQPLSRCSGTGAALTGHGLTRLQPAIPAELSNRFQPGPQGKPQQ